jgi:DHA2 family multidrug resistance protein-like MFS transporter
MPSGLAAEAWQSARDTLGGALAVASRLPSPAGGELIAAARGAFTRSLQWVAVTSACVTAVIACLATVMLRRGRVASSAA